MEIVALLLLVAASLWLPKQQSLFSTEKISSGQAESDSYLNLISTNSLLMTSDKVVLPEAWSGVAVDGSAELRVLKLRSKQVRFVQTLGAAVDRAPASENAEAWVVDSVKRLGLNGQVETLQVTDVDGERTTPYVELGTGYNDFSVVYHHKHDKSRTQRKKIRLVSTSDSAAGIR